jgi:hypothetical protein
MLVTTASGVVTYDDVRSHLTAEAASGVLSRPEFIDARDAEPVLSSEEVRALVSLIRGYAAEHTLGPTAVLVNSDFAYGIVRMLHSMLDDVFQMHPFREAEAASAWLASASPTEGGRAP